MPGMSFVWIILILVIRYCFGFRISCFGFTDFSFHKAEPNISAPRTAGSSTVPEDQVFVNSIKMFEILFFYWVVPITP